MLSKLPESLKECKNLEVLHLDDNDLRMDYWYGLLAAELPRLRAFTPIVLQSSPYNERKHV